MTALAQVDPEIQAREVPARGPFVRRLGLTWFRNYESLRLELGRGPVVLTGANGSGKTNLLEAISFLAPGRGLRRARLSEVDTIVPGANTETDAETDTTTEAGTPPRLWAVSADIEGALGAARLGTGRDAAAAEAGSEKRAVRIDGEPAKSQTALADHLAVSWLTPQMDRLFIEGASQRRRFLDRLVYAFDPQHAGRMNSYTHALRERGRLLRQGRTDAAWHAALEDQIALTGVVVAAARNALLERLAPVSGTGFGPFPGALLAIDGEVETWLAEAPAVDVEDRFRAALAEGRTLSSGEPAPVPGPHRSDLRVTHSAKSMPAERCSTGEQKALLIAIVLAHARVRAGESGAAPLLLLDEVAAHLDAERRAALYDLLDTLGSQAWLTGTDDTLFAPLKQHAQMFTVSNGVVTRH